jgi:hypothetical protein
MMDEFREVFREVTASAAALSDLHPRRLDRWWTTLVGAPEPIYMQLGCNAIFKQVDQAAAAVKAMVDLLGEDNLPVAPQELARRHIRYFGWHVASSGDQGTHVFGASWDRTSSSWKLECASQAGTTKTVRDLEQAIEKAVEWASELDQHAAELREKTGKSDPTLS